MKKAYDDSTDQPHAITAHIQDCEFFVTFDHGFGVLKNRFRVVTPTELLKELESPPKNENLLMIDLLG